MIAVKAMYDQGKIRFLEPPPAITHALIAVIFLEPNLPESITADLDTAEWGEPMDQDGAVALLALHEELAPYRTEAEATLTVGKESLP